METTRMGYMGFRLLWLIRPKFQGLNNSCYAVRLHVHAISLARVHKLSCGALRIK